MVTLLRLAAALWRAARPPVWPVEEARSIRCLDAEPDWADAPALPIPLLSEEQAKALAEADAAEADAWYWYLRGGGDNHEGEKL